MPRWLSGVVPSQLQIAHELAARASSPTSIPGRRRLLFWIRRRLDDFDFWHAVATSLILPLVYLITAAVHTGLSQSSTDTHFDSTIAGVVATLVSILIAIVVFSVQLHASRKDEGELAVRYIIQTHRVYPILALGIGIVLANAGATMIPAIWPSMRLEMISCLNLLLVVAVFLCALRLTYVTLQDSGRSSFETVIPLFKQEMLLSLAENIRWQRMTDALKETWTKQLGLNWGYPAAAAWRQSIDFSFSTKGVIIGVNLRALTTLAEILHKHSSEYKSYLNISIGQNNTIAPVLKLVPVKHASNSQNSTSDDRMLDSPSAFRSRVQTALDDIPRFAKTDTTSQSLRDFLGQYGVYLRELVQSRRVPKLEAALQHLKDVAREWARADPEAPLGTIPRWETNTFYGPLSVNLTDAILAAIRIEDEDTLDTFVTFLNRLAMLAIQDRLPSLLREIGGLLQFTYYQATVHVSLNAYCTRRFDEAVYYLFLRFKSRQRWHDDTENEAETFEEERVCLYLALQTILHLIKFAIERNRIKDATQFISRLYNHEEYESPHHAWNDRAPTSENVDTLLDYVRIVLAGWCVTHIDKYPEESDAAKAVLLSIVDNQLSILRLMGVWEFYRPEAIHHAPIDYHLGVEHWDLDDPREQQIGIGKARTRDIHWIDCGLHVLLLHAEKSNSQKVSEYFPTHPPRFIWDEKRSRTWLEMLASIEPIAIPEKKRTKQIESTLDPIRRRQHAADLAYIERAITEPIDQVIWEKFISSVGHKWKANRKWFDPLNSLCSSFPEATLIPWHRVCAGPRIWRDFFVPGNNWADDFGAIIGEPLAFCETSSLLRSAQQVCQKDLPILKIAEMDDHLRTAIAKLRKKGYSPNLIFLPSADRFAAALFKAPLWKVSGRHKFGEASWGEWEGMLVLRWPYTNAEFVMVADACRLFGRQEVGPNQLNIVINDFTEQERNELLNKMREKVAKGQSPSNDDVRVMVEAWLIPEYGIADKDAAILLSLNESDGSYAISTKDNFYHRRACEDIHGDDSLTLTLAKRLEGEREDWSPCPRCQPDKMDLE